MYKTKISRVSILGCGWLGFPLARLLNRKGYKIKGSTTSPGKAQMLQDAGIAPYLVQFGLATEPDLTEFLRSDILIILIPPGKRLSGGYENYLKMIDQLKGDLMGSDIRKIVLASSTSVYADDAGRVTEGCDKYAETEAAKILLYAEGTMASVKAEVTIVRLAGLLGPGRHPGRFFAGKTGVPSGLSPVNLIHLEDATGIIEALIRREDMAGIWNASAPEHPARKDFYSLATAMIGLTPPEFIEERGPTKIVTSERIQELSYDFKYPDLLKWLEISE